MSSNDSSSSVSVIACGNSGKVLQMETEINILRHQLNVLTVEMALTHNWMWAVFKAKIVNPLSKHYKLAHGSNFDIDAIKRSLEMEFSKVNFDYDIGADAPPRHKDKNPEAASALESAKLQPSPDLEKRVEASQHSLAEQNLLLHQNRKDAPAINQPGVVSTADEQRREREFDPNLKELLYEPLDGLGTHGPAKLLAKLKAKRGEGLKNGPKAGDDDASLGAGWAQILTMNSSIYDEALSDFASELVPRSRRPRQAGQTGLAVANAKAKVKAENASVSSPASTSRQAKKPKSAGGQPAQSPRENAGVPSKGQPFKECPDYYFQTHPTFMQMVQDVETTPAFAPTPAPARPLPDSPKPATGNRNTKRTPITGFMGNANTLAQKMEIKTVTSARPADVLYKPPIGKQLLLASNSESRTTSGLLDLLDATAAVKGKGPQQTRDGRDGGQHAHTTLETATERQKRIKAEKDDKQGALAQLKSTRVTTLEKRIICQYCSKLCGSNAERIEHERVHTREKPFSCRFCKHPFTTNAGKKRHERIHTGEKPFECRFCKQRFTQSTHKTLHESISCPFMLNSRGRSPTSQLKLETALTLNRKQEGSLEN